MLIWNSNNKGIHETGNVVCKLNLWWKIKSLVYELLQRFTELLYITRFELQKISIIFQISVIDLMKNE